MTAEAMATKNQRKIISILKQQFWPDSAPNWLLGKQYINLSPHVYYKNRFQKNGSLL
jgi:hypothetical protein